MTMAKRAETVPTGEFKAKCLGYLGRVAQNRESFLITKRGKPVAKLVPVEGAEGHDLDGSIVHHGDVLSPIDARWDAEK